MRNIIFLAAASTILFSTAAQANLCKSVQKLKAVGSAVSTTTKTKNDTGFFEKLFPHPAYHGDRRWNEAIVQCNRQRDSHGKRIAKATAVRGNNAGKKVLKSRNLKAKLVRGKYNFFGNVVTQQKYIYVLSKKKHVWEMVIPYRPIISDVVKDRIDFNFAHARMLYGASEVKGVPGRTGLYMVKPDARPISVTLCSSFRYFRGKEGKYDAKELHQRDARNKFISRGKIEYKYTRDGSTRSGCRVRAGRVLYYRADPAMDEVIEVKPRDWVLDNFVRTAEKYWSIKNVFRLRILMKGRNEAAFKGHPALRLFGKKDHLTIRFATKFLPYKFNQMYKSNPIQFLNFSTMTTDNTYWHEVGHAFGLDDEYGKWTEKDGFKENGCEADKYRAWGSSTYQMCAHNVVDKRLIYHYLAVSRYIAK